eukprot:TRINITY_DN15192_c0_g1_i1.p1 TRINITY_DN15192_c0_g1~~TRINITY_DN15192_c0_g1_i1.p1  ORF type:complete len:908 (-),score=217.86 TRINITY_DN15192_c0_g1_i1:103-2454(-)
MEARELKLDLIGFNSGLAACEKSGRWEMAGHLLSTIPSYKLTPDVISYNSFIAACGHDGDWEMALAALESCMVKKVPMNVVSYNAVLAACGPGGAWEAATCVLALMPAQELQPDIVGFNAVMSSCQKAGQWQRSLALLVDLPEFALLPDTISFNTVVSSCDGGRAWEHAVSTVALMQSVGIPRDEVTFTALISAVGKGALWQAAMILLDDMAGERLEVGLMAYTAALSACENGGAWEVAMTLFNKVQEQELQLNTISCNAAISAAAVGGQWLYTLSLLDGLETKAIRKDSISYNAAISSLDKAMQWLGTIQLLQEMRATTVSVNAIGLSAALSACCQCFEWPTALSLLDELGGQASDIACSNVVEACCGGGRWEIALALMMDWEARHDPIMASYSFLLSDFQAKGHRTLEAALWQHLARKLEASDSSCSGFASVAQIAAAVGVAKGCLGQLSLKELLTYTEPHLVAPSRRAKLSTARYGKELELLWHLVRRAREGDAAAVAAAVDEFATELQETHGSWSKVAGASKAQLIEATVRSAAPVGRLLEIGTYVGYATVRMAMAVPSSLCPGVVTVEVDPVHAAVARNVLELAGLSDHVLVLTGHSRLVLPRLRESSGQSAAFSFVFMDRWGSQYMQDFSLLENDELMAPGAVIVADNTLWTGAALYLWHVMRGEKYKTVLAPVQEVGTEAEDWMSVSVKQGGSSPRPPAPELPPALAERHREAERLRASLFSSGGRKITPADRLKFAKEMQEALASEGISPCTTRDALVAGDSAGAVDAAPSASAL